MYYIPVYIHIHIHIQFFLIFYFFIYFSETAQPKWAALTSLTLYLSHLLENIPREFLPRHVTEISHLKHRNIAKKIQIF